MARPRKSVSRPVGTVIGYVRCSTSEQADSGLGLQAQRSAIQQECERRGLELVRVYEDAGFSAKTLKRPGLAEALEALQRGEAAALCVSRLDRLSRSVLDACGLLERASKEGWSLTFLDLNIDTSSPSGEAMATMLATFAQMERRLIGARTKDALAAKVAAGGRVGRPVTMDDEIVERILEERRGGAGWSQIAQQLNADQVPTSQGGAKWYPSTVRAVAAKREPALV